MSSKKLGALLRSVPPATAREPAELPPSAPAVAVAAPEPAVLPEPTIRKQARPMAVVEPEVPLQVLIPANIRKQLALKAAEEGQSLRALMLQAIRSLGIAVTDADIKGKRGRQRA
jgi:hypothetical protein